MWAVIGILIKISLVTVVLQGIVAYMILLERKVAAYAQDRLGPNRAGRIWGLPFGLLQPLADGAKMLLKEDVIPSYVNKPVFILAPCISIFAATIAFAVVPFGPVGAGAPFGINFQIAPYLNIGVLYVFAVGSLAVYGVILAGWSSNNKYSFLGGLRSSAQLISYEIPLGMSILGLVLIVGSLDLTTIINWQDGHGYWLNNWLGVPSWGVFVQPIGCLLFVISAFAETNRLPFDLPEAEQELVGGYHTEYSAMKFGMFFLAEYLHVITVSFLTVILFFGGWDAPFLNQLQTDWFTGLLKALVMFFKAGLMVVFIMWVRWTVPRFRYDQLMDLAWKSLIPIALINLVATASFVHLIWR